MIRTYLDAGVLIAAVRGDPPVAGAAKEVLADPEREFISSAFVRLEVLPKAVYHHRATEVALYRHVFARVAAWAETSEDLVNLAEREAARYGLNALESLHLAAAQMLGADEFVTTERLGKPIHRATNLRVTAI